MKANRKFVEADEAVSPVIAVILMVAITVVLAATVFVLVSDIGSNTSKTQPSVGWNQAEVDDRIEVNQAPTSINWNIYQIKSSVALVEYALNVDTPATACDDCVLTTANVYEQLDNDADGDAAADIIAGGDFLDFCGPSGATITLLHIESNSVAYTATFTSLAACP